jgi:NMD protein affecting ribosome stability and mRNA decay
MKPIKCCECGEIIENGYAVNPEVSAICETCYSEKQKDLLEDADITGENINDD